MRWPPHARLAPVEDSTWSKLASLPLEIESYELEPYEFEVSDQFTRLTTVIRLRGAGEDGVGEDVCWDALDQIAFRDAGPVLPITGQRTLGSLAELLAGLDLFPAPPVREEYRGYRRWAFESAALDLALRQAGTSLADHLGMQPKPLNFVVSLRLPEPPTFEPIRRRLELYPTLRFKLDATSSWTDELIELLAGTGAVDSIDFKGHYRGTSVDQPPDPELYRRIAEAFPDAWIEDPALTPETDAVLKPHRDRITWDAPIHSMADVDALPFAPQMVNVKPSRLGPLANLCHAYDECARRGVGMYGGGQWELSVGRGQAQYLASLFHPDTPNDIAPGGYNDPAILEGLPPSPLEPRLAPTGFRWE